MDSTAPTSTTNITGLRIIVRGSSLAQAAGSWVDQHPGVEQAGADPGGAGGASGASVGVVIG